jgi:glucosamine-6-phosphate deaminase
VSFVGVRILDSAEAVALAAADICSELIRHKPDARLGLAAGATPRALYTELIRRYRSGALSFSRVETFNLDEYVGVGPEHPRSFHREMRERLFDHVDIAPGSRHLPQGDAPDPHVEAERYEALIAARGGIDLQILGLGRNGHIGFNEPGTALDSITRVTTLSLETIRDNQLEAAGFSPPVLAITMGVGTILNARAVLMLATGAPKAPAVAAALEGPVGASCPASAIQRHPNVTVLLDRAAAGELHR